MVTIGNDTTPGSIITLESSTSTGVNVSAPANVVIVGQADLANGTASADTAEQVNTPREARDLFGSGSKLATAIVDALSEGAYPVYAIAPPATSVSGEDLSGLGSNTGSLANAPVTEDPDDISFTVDSTSLTTTIYLDGDPRNVSASDIPDDEVYVNPVTAKFHISDNITVGNASDDVDYDYFDFTDAHEEIKSAEFGGDKLQDLADLVFNLSENDTQFADLQTTIGEMENNKAFAIACGGAGDPYITDTSTYSNPDDDSRVQYYYPSRNSDGETILGSIAGLRARLGIDRSPMFKRLPSQTSLRVALSQAQRENLIGENVNPVQDQSQGAKVYEDLTSVSDSNSEEANFDTGIARLIVDYIAEYADRNVDPFIGKLHTQSARNALRGIIASELRRLLGQNSITAFSLNVSEVDANAAALDIGVKTIDPLRNIEVSVVAGDVVGGTGGN